MRHATPRGMSAYGPKRTSCDLALRSAFDPNRDVSRRLDAGRPRESPAGDDPLLDLVHRLALDAIEAVVATGPHSWPTDRPPSMTISVVPYFLLEAMP